MLRTSFVSALGVRSEEAQPLPHAWESARGTLLARGLPQGPAARTFAESTRHTEVPARLLSQAVRPGERPGDASRTRTAPGPGRAAFRGRGTGTRPCRRGPSRTPRAPGRAPAPRRARPCRALPQWFTSGLPVVFPVVYSSGLLALLWCFARACVVFLETKNIFGFLKGNARACKTP